MSANPFRRLQDLLARPALQVGDVATAADGAVEIEVPGGGRVVVRGEAVVGARVYFRDGAIEGPAPALPFDTVEV